MEPKEKIGYRDILLKGFAWVEETDFARSEEVRKKAALVRAHFESLSAVLTAALNIHPRFNVEGACLRQGFGDPKIYGIQGFFTLTCSDSKDEPLYWMRPHHLSVSVRTFRQAGDVDDWSKTVRESLGVFDFDERLAGKCFRFIASKDLQGLDGEPSFRSEVERIDSETSFENKLNALTDRIFLSSAVHRAIATRAMESWERP